MNLCELEKALICENPCHGEEPLYEVCLSLDCPTPGLICYLCQLQSHSDHKIMHLHELLRIVKEQNNSAGIIMETAQIDILLQELQSKIIELKDKFQNAQNVIATFKNFQGDVVESLSRYNKSVGQLQAITHQKQSTHFVNKFNLWIAKNMSLCLNTDQSNDKKEKQQKQEGSLKERYFRKYKEQINGVNTEMIKLKKLGKFEDTDFMALLAPISASSIMIRKLYFTQELMGTCMSLISPQKAAYTKTGNQRMILLMPSLQQNLQVKRWKVLVEKMASWVGVGVACFDKIKNVNFDFQYTSSGHGNYLISSNGYAWNGYKMEFNSKFEPFSFTTGDTIAIQYDPKQSKVSFKKQGTELTYSLDIDPDEYPIHAAVNLTGIGDAVEIIQ